MPTVSIEAKVALATGNARTILTGFNKAISTGSTTTKTLVLNGGQSGSLLLNNSAFLIIIGNEDILNVTIQNRTGQISLYENTGFVMIHASNLDQVLIQNMSTKEHEVQIIF